MSMEHLHNGNCCHGHEHEAVAQRIAMPLGNLCVSGACSHIEHQFNQSLTEQFAANELLRSQIDKDDEDDEDDEIDPVTGKKKKKKSYGGFLLSLVK